MSTTTMISGSSSNCDCDIILPQDVIFHILLFLPVIALLRLKSVCKSWCALIQSSSFINQHLHHHHHHHHNHNQLEHNNYNLLIADRNYLIGLGSCRPFTLFLFTGTNNEVPSKKLTFDSPYFLEIRDSVVNMITCNGVICLHICDLARFRKKLNVCLWNPATRQLRALPEPEVFIPPLPDKDFPDNPDISLGFGFDVKTNDYKVIRIFTFCMPHNLPRAEVYSLNTDSWKTIEAVLPIDYVVSNPNAPYRNGTYCWVGRITIFDTPVSGNFIFSFDFSKEVFETMSLPDVDSVKYDFMPQLAIVKDSIAFINTVDGSEFEVWMLNTYGVKESWTKLYKVGPFLGPTPIGLSRNGNFLFLVRDQQFCMYNIVTKEIKILSSQGMFYPNRIEIAEYKESLVSVGKGHGGAISPACMQVVAEHSAC